ncbi:hypothetical protein SGQ83_00145 [Flavobacterium sp. Fl-318]|uniref:Uncharacterized protein n=1 Tax=Flavobacterium cupriresistens TaxID=2893885 RepID=A0ABU4R583_9FLAO|nr:MULTISPECIES: hypothetical protein [unclassified Flavobacterium]MDX6187747.1 hypothetical protein [Flavobacterium sp. Fl-318]UFH42330.1 hypothetical protein LNP23_21305 [Flavobacterium sp. F-323]
MTDIQLHNLKVDIFNQAKIYIETLREFAPFGSTILNNEITPLGYYSDEEIVDSNNAIEILQQQLSKKIKANLIEAGAVAFDVIANFKNGDGISEKRDALCLKISKDGENWSEEYFPYLIIEGECIWK